MSASNNRPDDDFIPVKMHYNYSDSDSSSSSSSSSSQHIQIHNNVEDDDFDLEFPRNQSTSNSPPKQVHYHIPRSISNTQASQSKSFHYDDDGNHDDIDNDFCAPDPDVGQRFSFNRSTSNLSSIGRAFSNLSLGSQHIVIDEESVLETHDEADETAPTPITYKPCTQTARLEPIASEKSETDHAGTQKPTSPQPLSQDPPFAPATLPQTVLLTSNSSPSLSKQPDPSSPSNPPQQPSTVLTIAPDRPTFNPKVATEHDDESGDQFQDVETPRNIVDFQNQQPHHSHVDVHEDDIDQENQRRIAAITLHSADLEVDIDLINENLHTRYLPDWCHCFCRGYVYQSVGRRSAFQLPFDRQQILVWVMLGLSLLFALLVWFLSEPLPVMKAMFGVAFLICIGFIVPTWLLVSFMETQAYKLSNIPTNVKEIMALDQRLFDHGQACDKIRDERIRNSATGVDPTEGRYHELADYVPVRQTLHDYMTSNWFCCYRHVYTPSKVTRSAPGIVKYSREKKIPQQKLPFWSRPYSYYMKVFGDFTNTVQYLQQAIIHDEEALKTSKVSTTSSAAATPLSPSRLTPHGPPLARGNSTVRGNSMVRGNSIVRANSIVRGNSMVRNSSVAPSLNRQPYLTTTFNDSASFHNDIDNSDNQSVVSTLSVSRKQQLLRNTNQWARESSTTPRHRGSTLHTPGSTATPSDSSTPNDSSTPSTTTTSARKSLFNKGNRSSIGGGSNISNSVTPTAATHANTNTNTNTSMTTTTTTTMTTLTTSKSATSQPLAINPIPATDSPQLPPTPLHQHSNTAQQPSNSSTLTASHPNHYEDSSESVSVDAIDSPTANRNHLQRHASANSDYAENSFGKPPAELRNNASSNFANIDEDEDNLRVSTVQPLPHFTNDAIRGRRASSHQRTGSLTSLDVSSHSTQSTNPSTPQRGASITPLTPQHSHSNSYNRKPISGHSNSQTLPSTLSFGARRDSSGNQHSSNMSPLPLHEGSTSFQSHTPIPRKRHSVFQFGLGDQSTDELGSHGGEDGPAETTYHKHKVSIINHSSQPTQSALQGREIPLKTGSQYYEDIIVDSQQQLVDIPPTTWWPHHLLSLYELYQLTGMYFKSSERTRIYSNLIDKYETQRQQSYAGSMRYQRVSAGPEHVFVSVSYNHRLNSRSGIHGSIEGSSGYYNDEVCVMKIDDVHVSYINHFDNILSLPFHVRYLGNANFPALPGVETPIPIFGVGKQQSRPMQQTTNTAIDTVDATVLVVEQPLADAQIDELRSSITSLHSESALGTPQNYRGRAPLTREVSFSQFTYVHGQGATKEQREQSTTPLHYNNITAYTSGHQVSGQAPHGAMLGTESFITETQSFAHNKPSPQQHPDTPHNPQQQPPSPLTTPLQPISLPTHIPDQIPTGRRVLTYIHDNQVTAQLEGDNFDYNQLVTQQRLYLNTKRGPLVCIDEPNHCLRQENSRGMVTASSNALIDFGFTPMVCTDCRILQDHRMLHCSHCNKCQEGFDHHCPYLNTCIGERNYYVFFILIMFLVLYALLGFVVSIRSLLLSFDIDIFSGLIEAPAQSTSGGRYYIGIIFGEQWVVYAIFSLLSLACFIAAIGAFGSLFCLHVYLIITKQTTRQLLSRWKAERLDKIQKRKQDAIEAERKRTEAEKLRQNSARQKSIKKSSKGVSLAVRWNIEVEYDQATLDPFLVQPRRQTIYDQNASGTVQMETISPYAPTPQTKK